MTPVYLKSVFWKAERGYRMPGSVCSSSEKKRRVEETIDSSNIRKRLFSELPKHRGGADGGNQKTRPSNTTSDQVTQSENKLNFSITSYWVSTLEEIRKERECLSAKAQICKNSLIDVSVLTRQLLEKILIDKHEKLSEEVDDEEEVYDRVPTVEFSSDC